ncbi:MAG: rhomboid family intramembrane serine protease [Flavobacteriales bacterium]
MKITFQSKGSLYLALFCVIGSFVVMNMPHTVYSQLFILNGQAQFGDWKWYLSLLTYVFGHTSMDHLLGNMSLLLILGPIIELKYGTQRFVWMSIITAIATAILHVILWDNQLLGFSGLVFMYIVLSTLLNIRNREIPFTFILVIILYFGMEILSSLKETQISHFAHLFGGAMGAFWGFNKK